MTKQTPHIKLLEHKKELHQKNCLVTVSRKTFSGLTLSSEAAANYKYMYMFAKIDSEALKNKPWPTNKLFVRCQVTMTVYAKTLQRHEKAPQRAGGRNIYMFTCNA